MNLLANFTPISLSEMAAVALLDRIDTKYVLTPSQLAAALPALQPFYRVLEIDGRRKNLYRTLYFDTPDFSLYRVHQSGRRLRYKVRSRQYVDTPLAFIEVKHKTGSNHTRKVRMPTPGFVTHLTRQEAEFLRDQIAVKADELEPKLWVDYTRITLVGSTTSERLTIDLDLRYSAAKQELALPGLVIAELKSQGKPQSSPFIQLMRQQLIRPCGFSKYCIGASLLYPNLKHNRFSRILRRIGQLQQGGR